MRLLGRVVWTRLRGTEHSVDGDRRTLYESGLEFTSLTSEQQVALADALARLRTSQTEEPSSP